jgi:hypothetical protein
LNVEAIFHICAREEVPKADGTIAPDIAAVSSPMRERSSLGAEVAFRNVCLIEADNSVDGTQGFARGALPLLKMR